ncbi:MAG: hypothetical protein ACRC8A_10280 [Microcoleaceae cyanobacterium]
MKLNSLKLLAIGVLASGVVGIFGSGAHFTINFAPNFVPNFTQRLPVGIPTLAQPASPKSSPSPKALAAAPQGTATPQKSPSPQAEKTTIPKNSPASAPVTPPPPSPQPEPSPSPEPIQSVEPLPLSESLYKDPQGQFQVGILQGYNIGFAGNSPLIEAPDGNLAYTVVVKPRESDRELSESGLAQIAIEAFERGEGFVPGSYQVTGPQEVTLPWSGGLNLGGKAQRITGSILTRQQGQNVLVLLVSATEQGAKDVEAVIVTLAETLTTVQ